MVSNHQRNGAPTASSEVAGGTRITGFWRRLVTKGMSPLQNQRCRLLSLREDPLLGGGLNVQHMQHEGTEKAHEFGAPERRPR